MANFGTFSTSDPGVIRGSKPLVYINYDVQPNITCLTVEDRADSISRAVLRLGARDLTITGPITLDRYPNPFKYGATVSVQTGNRETIFCGMLTRRMDQGANDSIIWEAVDFRHLLNYIPVRGAFVWDETDGKVKFIPAYRPRFNPEGKWNCVGASIGSSVVPVFSPVAERGLPFETPDAGYSTAAAAGVISPWTPAKALQYLHFAANAQRFQYDGLDTNWWRCLRSASRIVWNADSLNLSSADSSTNGSVDSYTRKLPDIDLHNMTMLGAITRIMDVVGSHGIYCKYTEYGSSLEFYSKTFLSKTESESEDVQINLLRGGSASTVDSAFDFELDEDSMGVFESALIEGERPHIESSFVYRSYNDPIEELKPVWSDEEEACFTDIIAGDSESAYAKYPSKQGSTTASLVADGKDGRLMVYKKTQAAVDLARQFFPTVFRAFLINTSAATVLEKLKGTSAGGKPYTAAEQFPVLKTPRMVAPEQLQFYKDDTNRLVGHYPVRVRVRDHRLEDEKSWVDTLYNNGLRLEGNGWFWLDGLAETADQTPYCVYGGSLVSDPKNVHIKDIKINCAVACDHRVCGYSEVEGADSQLDPKVQTDVGGYPLAYVEAHGSYRGDQQVESDPAPFKTYLDSVDQSAPLDRWVPGSGDERAEATAAAQRKLFSVKNVRRNSKWSIVGIRPDYSVGKWVSSVTCKGGPSGDARTYSVNAPIKLITYDFVNQCTHIGGLISQIRPGEIRAQKQSGGEMFGGANATSNNMLQSFAGQSANSQGSGGRDIGRSFAGQSADSRGMSNSDIGNSFAGQSATGTGSISGAGQSTPARREWVIERPESRNVPKPIVDIPKAPPQVSPPKPAPKAPTFYNRNEETE